MNNEQLLPCAMATADSGKAESAVVNPIPQMVSRWLEALVAHYDAQEWCITANGLQRTSTYPVTVYHGRPFPISIAELILRLTVFREIDIQVVLVAAVYLSRLLERDPLPVSSFTVHRLVVVAILVALKFTYDKCPSNKAMAAAVGLSVAELNQLEVKFLCGVGYELGVSPSDIKTAVELLRTMMGRPEKDMVEPGSKASAVENGVVDVEDSAEDSAENSNESGEDSDYSIDDAHNLYYKQNSSTDDSDDIHHNKALHLSSSAEATRLKKKRKLEDGHNDYMRTAQGESPVWSEVSVKASTVAESQKSYTIDANKLFNSRDNTRALQTVIAQDDARANSEEKNGDAAALVFSPELISTKKQATYILVATAAE